MKDTQSLENAKTTDLQEHKTITKNESRNVLLLGVGALIFIPFFKSSFFIFLRDFSGKIDKEWLTYLGKKR